MHQRCCPLWRFVCGINNFGLKFRFILYVQQEEKNTLHGSASICTRACMYGLFFFFFCSHTQTSITLLLHSFRQNINSLSSVFFCFSAHFVNSFITFLSGSHGQLASFQNAINSKNLDYFSQLIFIISKQTRFCIGVHERVYASYSSEIISVFVIFKMRKSKF